MLPDLIRTAAQLFNYHDLIVMGGLRCFPIIYQFLVKLLTRTQPRINDEYVLVRLQTADSDHLPGKIQDAQGFTHVKKIDLTAFSHGPCLKNQLTGLGECHKIAGYFRMGDGKWAPRFYLFFKPGYYRPAGTQYITKTGGVKLCAACLI